MNKKIIAMAVGSALGVIGAQSVAFAQASTVVVSGNLNFYYGYFDNGGQGYAARTGTAAGVSKLKTDSMVNSESEFVLTGQENLGGGMAAYFRCASSMDIVAGGASNMCGRTSYIGLKGNFGSINWGNNDTPYKRMAAMYDPFPISAANGQGWQMWNGVSSAVGNGNSTTVTAGQNSSFSRRQNNLITYDMKTISGFDAAIAVTATNEGTAQNSASTVQKARLWSAMVNYSNGPLLLGVGYERHTDYNPGASTIYTGGTDSAWTLAAGYTFMGKLKLSAIANRLNWNNITPGLDMSVNTWGAYADWSIAGPHKLRAGYGSQGNTKGSYGGTGTSLGVMTANAGTGGTGAQRITLEYAYAMSKRTEASLAYARINNDRASNITIGSGGSTPNFGESQSYMGMRLRHTF